MWAPYAADVRSLPILSSASRTPPNIRSRAASARNREHIGDEARDFVRTHDQEEIGPADSEAPYDVKRILCRDSRLVLEEHEGDVQVSFVANDPRTSFRGITSITDRYPGWGWDFANGLMAVLLGAYVSASWPVSSLWVLGTVVGA